MSHRPTDAWLRGGAGPMKDRRAPRGGERRAAQREIDEALEEIAQEPEPDAVESGATKENPMTKPTEYSANLPGTSYPFIIRRTEAGTFRVSIPGVGGCGPFPTFLAAALRIAEDCRLVDRWAGVR